MSLFFVGLCLGTVLGLGLGTVLAGGVIALLDAEREDRP